MPTSTETTSSLTPTKGALRFSIAGSRSKRSGGAAGVPRGPEHPDFQLEERGELERDALELHRKAETYARTHEMDYADAYRGFAEGRLQVD